MLIKPTVFELRAFHLVLSESLGSVSGNTMDNKGVSLYKNEDIDYINI